MRLPTSDCEDIGFALALRSVQDMADQSRSRTAPLTISRRLVDVVIAIGVALKRNVAGKSA